MAPRRAKASANFNPEPFTATGLRKLFDRERIVQKGMLPNKVGFQIIEDNLNGVQQLISLQNGPWRISSERSGRIIKALNTLASDIPELCLNLQEGNPWKGVRSNSTIRVYADSLAQLEALSAALTAFGPPSNCMALIQILKITQKVERWHDYATALVEIFTNGMEGTNPGIKLGLSNAGPYQRFIAAVVPNLSNEMPTPGAVGKYLKTLPRPGT